MLTRTLARRDQRGFTLLEVLLTMAILAFGMLALANLQVKINLSHLESYQRAQAVVLLQDMVDRISNNRAAASATPGTSASYVTGTTGVDNPVGAPNAPVTCTGTPGAVRDKCEWQNELLGAAETSGANKSGAMIGARGCVERLQAPNPATGVCAPAIFRVTVAWQGVNSTIAPGGLACGQNQYGNGTATDDTYRRVISQQITIGLPTCS